MPTIQINHKVGAGKVLTDATSVVLADPASPSTYGVKRNDTSAVVVTTGTAMTKQSTGVYVHTFTDPAYDLTYTYWVKIVYGGNTYYSQGTKTGLATPSTGSDVQTYADLYGAMVSRWGLSTATAKARAKEGTQRFLRAHPWAFLPPEATLTLVADSYTTDLPSNFGFLTKPFTYAASAGYGFRGQVDGSTIREWQSGNDSTGYPEYFAVEPKTQSLATGQRFQAAWFPRPSQALTFYYQYATIHAAMVNDADYMPGGGLHNHAIEAACHAECEIKAGQLQGPFNAYWLSEALPASIRIDADQRTGAVIGNLRNRHRAYEIAPGTLDTESP